MAAGVRRRERHRSRARLAAGVAQLNVVVAPFHAAAGVARQGATVRGQPVLQVRRVARAVALNRQVRGRDVDHRVRRVFDRERGRRRDRVAAGVRRRERHRSRARFAAVVAQLNVVVGPSYAAAGVARQGATVRGQPVLQVRRVARAVALNRQVRGRDVDHRVRRVFDRERGRRRDRVAAGVRRRERHRSRARFAAGVAQARVIVAPSNASTIVGCGRTCEAVQPRLKFCGIACTIALHRQIGRGHCNHRRCRIHHRDDLDVNALIARAIVS